MSNSQEILLDSNIIIYLSKSDPGILSIIAWKYFCISVVTDVEVFGYHGLCDEERYKLVTLCNTMEILEFDDSIRYWAKHFMNIYRLKAIDAIIVATAKIHNISLITSDKKLEKVTEVDVILYIPE